jgi:hypothetical protein
MLLIDLPFVATGLHMFFPWWPECALLWTAWLTFPMTSGAKLLTEAAAPPMHRLMFGSQPPPGMAVQVDPIKPKLKPPVHESLKLKYDKLLSNIALTFNLRRYTPGRRRASR